MRSAPGNMDDRSFLEAIREDRPDGGPEFNPDRYFRSQHEPIRTAERTYALTNQWGVETGSTIQSLLKAFPDKGVSCTAEEDV